MCNRTDCAGSWAGPMACAVCKVGPMSENNKNSGLYMKNDILGPGGSTLTDADLARLEELADEATPRPWIMAKDCDESDHMEVTDEKGVVCCTDLYGFEYPEQWDNGRYISAACNAVPSLVAEVRRLRAENEQMKHGMEAAYMVGKADGGEAIS